MLLVLFVCWFVCFVYFFMLLVLKSPPSLSIKSLLSFVPVLQSNFHLESTSLERNPGL